MIKILSEEFMHADELDILIWLLDSGLDYYHVRKKTVSESELYSFLEKIPLTYRSQVVLHHPVSTLGFLNHHTSKERRKQSTNCHSCSVHSLSEVNTYKSHYPYLFWSPVFDSISKQGYKKNENINLLGLDNDLRKKLIALGGVEPAKFSEIKDMGFSHIAIKGWFWNRKGNYKQAWRDIQTTWQELEKKY